MNSNTFFSRVGSIVSTVFNPNRTTNRAADAGWILALILILVILLALFGHERVSSHAKHIYTEDLGPGLPDAAVENCTPDAGYNRCVAYTYTGADQAFVVPTSVTQINVKAWGAGSGGSISVPLNIGAPGGSGAYVAGVLSTTPGSQYTVMVGQGGAADGTTAPSGLCANGAYGFGGSCPPPRGNYVDGGSGGGLSGLFTGSAAITATDQARAVFVAGGGGAGEGTNACGNLSAGGGAGGNAFAGAMPTMQGVNGAYNPALPGANPTGGGGGYFGGDGTSRLRNGPCAFSANGGSNFVDPGVTDPVNLAGNEAVSVPQFTANAAPNNTDPHYTAGIGVGQLTLGVPGGNGLVVIQWLLVPTAANVMISGRVLTANGRGIGYARVGLIDPTGVPRMALTNPFGYYSLHNVPAGQTYVLTARAKGHVFDSQVVTVNDDVTGLNFVALAMIRARNISNCIPGVTPRTVFTTQCSRAKPRFFRNNKNEHSEDT